MPDQQVEQIIGIIATMDRSAVTRELLEFRAAFPVDFTAEYLGAQSLDRLRHILAALCLQTRQMPSLMPQTTAA